MYAKLKNIYSYDTELKYYQGDEEGCIGIELVLEIGTTSSDEVDTFNVFVCSADYLEKYTNKPRLIFNTLLVKDFDLIQIHQLIDNFLMSCSGKNWQEIKNKICKVFPHEYGN